MVNIEVSTTINGSTYQQFGKEILITQMKFQTLRYLFDIDYDVQRQLDIQRRREIRNFILASLEADEPFYFSPFVFSSRDSLDRTDDGFELMPGRKLYISDGQHRMSALLSAHSQLTLKREAAEEAGKFSEAEELEEHLARIESYPISMQIYLSLSREEERQMFSDLNSERRDAHSGLIVKYDQRDSYSRLTREVADLLKEEIEVEMELSRLTSKNSALTSLTTMRKCMIALLEGNVIVKPGDPYRLTSKREALTYGRHFFMSWKSLFPKRVPKHQQSVYKLSGIQIALALTAATLRKEHGMTHIEAIDQLKHLNKQCTWRADDPLFIHLYDPTTHCLRNHSNSTAIKRTTVGFLRAIRKEMEESR
ncbi:DNA sulfur modification protein DndB [Sporosarcina sp. 179-K 3D1 HS]|uniref:DNA sulfur modification protein DndB n=1 Tax=Sporosarcina sp. 179-K 3D1 HS TaxID=3232169 RepID=UPI0039A0884C